MRRPGFLADVDDTGEVAKAAFRSKAEARYRAMESLQKHMKAGEEERRGFKPCPTPGEVRGKDGGCESPCGPLPFQGWGQPCARGFRDPGDLSLVCEDGQWQCKSLVGMSAAHSVGTPALPPIQTIQTVGHKQRRKYLLIGAAVLAAILLLRK